MNEVIKNSVTRRSIRKYKSEQIKPEELDQILTAGIHTANGMNLQPFYLVAVTDKETRDELEALNSRVTGGKMAAPFYGAPCVVVVLYDPNVGHTGIYDATLALGNMMNAAHSIDVDSCWIHRAKETFEFEEGKALLKKWGLPEDLVGVGNLILGYRDCEYPAPKEKRSDIVVYVK